MGSRSVFIISVFIAPMILAFVNPTQKNEVCISGPSELLEEASVTKTVESFGGLDQLLGTWKLSGMAGNFVSLNVSIFAEDNQFYVQANNDPKKAVWICSTHDNSTTLFVRVLHPAKPENNLFMLQSTIKQNIISIASLGSGWKFKTFKKIESLLHPQS